MFIYIALGIVIVAGAGGYFWYQRSGKTVENKAHHQEAGLKVLKLHERRDHQGRV